MTLRVVGAGLQTTVQDLGRRGHQHDGVPGSGAMDRAALRVGNALVGNDDSAAALEATLIGPGIVFTEPTLIAITGGDLDPTIDGQPIPLWRAVHVRAGTKLSFGRPKIGCRAYVSVAGGIDVPMIFDSRSTYLRGQFGGHEGRALRRGDVLATQEPSALSQSIADAIQSGGQSDRPAIASWSAGFSLRMRYSSEPVVRLIAGEHADLLAAPSRTRLFSASFNISASSDRMGYRLEGVELPLRTPVELLSEGVAFGTVQLPPDGMPIVLMADRQTTGGYPRIGEVASVDLPLIAQLKPGDRLRFRPISIEEAQQLYLTNEQDLEQARAAIAMRHPREKS
ncbi:MAG TPA: biotin-dependent carboxyltransferase family protein [Gemmatimonadaceae bacterium]|jgi:antagonist of KipI|nr:biotin-dependent carboxyltransferase family protein [Gemmatimonadaceae bacterium]